MRTKLHCDESALLTPLRTRRRTGTCTHLMESGFSPDHDQVLAVVDRLMVLAEGCPIDDLLPGFKLTAQSKRERNRVLALLKEAERLLEQCISREEPLCEPFYDAFELQERRQWAAERREADPLN